MPEVSNDVHVLATVSTACVLADCRNFVLAEEIIWCHLVGTQLTYLELTAFGAAVRFSLSTPLLWT